MDIVKLWGKTVKDCVNRYAKNQTRETKEDYEQECFVRICEVIDVIEKMVEEQGNDAAKNYVYGICHNKIIDLIRSEKRLSGTLSLDDRSVAAEIQSHTAETIANFGVSEPDLDEAVKQLPRVEQHVIRSIYFHKMTEENLAKSLSKTKWWVQQVKKDAVVQLREILESK